MQDSFTIQIDRLKEGAIQKIDTRILADFFEINEPDLHFNDIVNVSGEAYVTDEDLILHLNAATVAQMSCSVCNRPVSMKLSVKGYYYTEPLTEIRDPMFDLRSIIREALLLELPKAAECNNNCPERATILPFLRKEASPEASTHYFPFNDLKLP